MVLITFYSCKIYLIRDCIENWNIGEPKNYEERNRLLNQCIENTKQADMSINWDFIDLDYFESDLISSDNSSINDSSKDNDTVLVTSFLGLARRTIKFLMVY